MNLPRPAAALLVVLAQLLPAILPAQDWTSFRGPDNRGVAAAADPPVSWSDEENVAWKTPLPGPGSSTPVVVRQRIYLTCFSGYGADREAPGEPADLKHHLLALDRGTGEVVWRRDFDGRRTEPARQVQINEHGFASASVACDGKRVFAYFGKLGLVACDAATGETAWQAELGTFETVENKEPRPADREGLPILRWGAAAPPVIHGDLVVVNASEESDSVRAFDRASGELVWKIESAALEGSAVPPAVYRDPEGKEVMFVVPGGELWAVDPATGARLWTVKTGTKGGLSATTLADGDSIYAFGGATLAVRWDLPREDAAEVAPSVAPSAASPGGGEAPLDPRVRWQSVGSDIPSAAMHDGKLFVVNMTGTGAVVDTRTGEALFRGRLPGRTGGVYASPVVAAGRLYVTSRERGTFVYTADASLELLARNELTEPEGSRFQGSPVVCGDTLFLRSDSFLYCIREDGD